MVFEQEVVVVAHQAEGVAEPGEAGNDTAELSQKETAITLIEEDQRACVPPARYVVEGVRELKAKSARHRTSVESPSSESSLQRPLAAELVQISASTNVRSQAPTPLPETAISENEEDLTRIL